MAVFMLIVRPPKMHKHLHGPFRISNTLTYRSCVLFLHKVMVCARQRDILNIRKFV